MSSAEASNGPSITIEVCNRLTTTGCHKIGGSVVEQIAGADGLRRFEAEENVQAKIGDLRTTLMCSGCLGICSAGASAIVTVGFHQKHIGFRTAEELSSKVQEWVVDAGKLPTFETQAEYDAWIAARVRQRIEEYKKGLQERLKNNYA